MDYLNLSLQTCADDIQSLRKCDVERFLNTAKRNKVLNQAQAIIYLHREDLVVECCSVVYDMHLEDLAEGFT